VFLAVAKTSSEVGNVAEVRSQEDSDPELSLRDIGLPDKTVQPHEQGMHNGGFLVAAWVGDRDIGHVLDTYREYGAGDPNVREVAGPGTGRDRE
jgi:hypothetical protein